MIFFDTFYKVNKKNPLYVHAPLSLQSISYLMQGVQVYSRLAYQLVPLKCTFKLRVCRYYKRMIVLTKRIDIQDLVGRERECEEKMTKDADF